MTVMPRSPRRRFPVLLLPLLGLALGPGEPPPPAAPDGSTFRLGGAVDRPGTYDVARLEREFADRIRVVPFTLKGEPGRARCIPLLALIEAAGPRPATGRRNPSVGFAVVVQGDDGYTVCFGLGELLPDAGGREVYVALDRDGGPLPPGEGPVRLIVPGDSRPSRWAYAVESITVVDAAGLVPDP